MGTYPNMQRPPRISGGFKKEGIVRARVACSKRVYSPIFKRIITRKHEVEASSVFRGFCLHSLPFSCSTQRVHVDNSETTN